MAYEKLTWEKLIKQSQKGEYVEVNGSVTEDFTIDGSGLLFTIKPCNEKGLMQLVKETPLIKVRLKAKIPKEQNGNLMLLYKIKKNLKIFGEYHPAFDENYIGKIDAHIIEYYNK